MKRRFALAAALLSATVLVSCAASPSASSGDTAATSTSGGKASEPATISLLVFKTPALDEKFWQSTVAEIKKQMPNLTVNIEYTPTLDRKAYALQLQSTGQLPDVVWEVPMSDFVRSKSVLAYPDSAGAAFTSQPTTVNGKIYGLPLGAQAIPFIYYNKSDFARAGITAPPKTWQEFVEACAKLKAAGETPLLAGGASDGWASSLLLNGILSVDLLGADSDWIHKLKAGKVSWTDPNVLASVEKWKSLVDAGYLNKDALSLGYTQLSEKFAAGDGAMYPMGSWAATTSPKGFEIGVFPLPSDNGDVIVPSFSGVVPFVSANTKYPDQALKFGELLAASPEVSASLALTDGLFPTLKNFTLPSGVSPLFTDSYQLFSSAPKTVPTLNWQQGDNELPAAFTDSFNKIAQKMILGATAQEGVAALDAAWQKANQR